MTRQRRRLTLTSSASRAVAATLVLTGVLLGLGAPAPAGDLPPAEKVLEKYAEAIGGEALTKVKNMSAVVDFSMPMQGVYATAEEFWVRPGKLYFRIDLASMGVSDFEAGVNDGVAWQSHPMAGTRLLSGAEKVQSLRWASRNPFGEWEKYYERAETAAEEVVGETPCHKVVFTPAEGTPLSAFFDKETGLLLREELEGPTGTNIVTTLSDYEETQGIRSPRTIKTEGPESYTLKITSVAYDVDEIPADVFELPASLKAAE